MKWRRLVSTAVLLITAALLVLNWPRLRFAALTAFGRDSFFRYASRNLTPEQKREFYAVLAENTPAGIWEAVPEPRVGRVLQPGVRKTDLRAEVRANAAGMRSGREFAPKAGDRFRIVCLGDSMVMGTAGREKDRWGDQIQEMLRARGVRVDGREVEVYSLGIGGWSAEQAASYLSARVSAYAPDLVLVMMVDNDLNDGGGVMGIGQATYAFASERRALGSGVLVDHWPVHFGFGQKNLLASGLGPESASRWTEAFAAWQRLESLVTTSGGRLLFGVLRGSELFVELCRRHHAKSGMTSPFLVTEYFGRRLPHDGHPNRQGHAILAGHYLHALSALNWLPLSRGDLPPLHDRLALAAEPRAPAEERVRALQEDLARTALPEEIDFARLDPAAGRAILGGIHPAAGEEPPALPYGSSKSVFLLKRRPGATRLRLEVEVPARIELYPYELRVRLDGTPAARLALPGPERAGRHTLEAPLPPGYGPAVEVSLRTERYWTTIDDFTMRSFRLVSVRQR